MYYEWYIHNIVFLIFPEIIILITEVNRSKNVVFIFTGQNEFIVYYIKNKT